MKTRIALAFLTLFLISCSGTTKSTIRYTAPSVNPARVQVNKAQANVAVAKTHAAVATEKIKQLEVATASTPALHDLATAAHGEVDQLTQSLLDAEQNLQDTQSELTALQVKNDQLTSTLNTTIDEKNAAILQAAEDRKHVHRLKFLVIGAVVAALGAILFQLKAFFFVLGPWGWAAMAAIPVAAASALWFVL